MASVEVERKETVASAWDIAQKVALSLKAKKLLTNELTPQEFIGRLIDESLYVDGLRFLPHTMPLRAAVWWACLATEHVMEHEETIEAEDLGALLAATDWCVEPSKANQENARIAGLDASVRTAAGCAAKAAFNAGSMSSPDSPLIPRSAVFAAKLSACSALVGAVEIPGQKLSKSYFEFLQLGIEVAANQNEWFSQEERYGE
ncbi:hypothetical protein Pan216_04740 [Planctomycetes bacterium Pan216]|uniref:Uncharacterized protein n=1 Tax=Kolteria novifilia TaxID=2527975 RepID=A0A518AY47_9BACT|nr:hypothetical protein Pan216_04740 [Planctomycetes bacterium Pan216]